MWVITVLTHVTLSVSVKMVANTIQSHYTTCNAKQSYTGMHYTGRPVIVFNFKNKAFK